MYLEFLKAYRAWLDDDAPEGDLFVRWAGLCLNLKLYAEQETGDDDVIQDVLSNLRGRLAYFHDDTDFPFNRGDRAHYDCEGLELKECHLNPQRIAFVDAEIARLS